MVAINGYLTIPFIPFVNIVPLGVAMCCCKLCIIVRSECLHHLRC